MVPRYRSLVSALGLLFCLSPAAASAEELAPAAVVGAYLAAYQSRDFASAYPLITKDMARSLDRDAWVADQERLVKMADAKIIRFETFPGKIEGDIARVPNVLVSKDKLFNQTGATEHELYTLVRSDGAWKIDRQRLVMPPELSEWFPPAAISEDP